MYKKKHAEHQSNHLYKEEIDWLIITFNTVNDKELEQEALTRLTAYGISEEQILERFQQLKDFEKQEKIRERAWEIQLEKNQYESYTSKEKLSAFFWGPYELFKMYDSSLSDLREANYQKMYWQRFILLIGGTLDSPILFNVQVL